MSKLIVFQSIISLYDCGIWCKSWVWEFSEDLWRTMKFPTCLRLARKWITHERPCEKYVLKVKESSAKRHLMTHLATRPTREMYCQLVLACFILVSSLITRLSVILCLHLSFLTLCALHLLFIVYVYVLECSSGFLHFIYSYSTLS